MVPHLDIGYYTTLCDLRIHEKPGLICWEIDRIIKSGSNVFVKRILNLQYSVWGNVEAGWICMYINHRFLTIKSECAEST